MIEPLECRLFLSATFRAGLLTVTGTDGNDLIRLSHPLARIRGKGYFILEADESITLVTINTMQFRFHSAPIRGIIIDAGAGDDQVVLWPAPQRSCFGDPGIVLPILDYSLETPTTIRGGSGADSIAGGRGGDKIFGGSGPDTIYGNDADDSIFGGSGDDYLYGASGNDLLRGGDGDDVLDGGPGSDRSFGGAGNDFLDGIDGDDQLWGGIGNDQLMANSSADSLSGGDGDDLLWYPDNEQRIPPFDVPADIERVQAFGQGNTCV